MAFCSNCGAQMTGSYCQNCGTPAGGGAYSDVPPASATTAGGLTTNVASALCYLFGLVTGIIFLLIAPYNRNKAVRFHAFQSIFAHIGLIVFYFVYSIFVGIVAVGTHGLGLGLGVLYPLFGLLSLLLWLYMMFTAFNNQRVKLPLVGDLAEKQA